MSEEESINENMDFNALIKPRIVPIQPDTIIFSEKVRTYCTLPYPRHPRGCPNYNHNPLCPPKAKMRRDILQKYSEFHLAIATFDYSGYIERMAEKHKDWSEAQLRNLIWWQKSVKKVLRVAILKSGCRFKEILGCGAGFMGCQSMESAGIFVFGTLQRNKIPFDIKAIFQVNLVSLLCGHHYTKLDDFIHG